MTICVWYDRDVKHQTVTATEFKAKCLALLDEVSTSGGTITVTKRGRPYAVVGPVKKRGFKSTMGAWRGKVHIPDEVLMSDMSELWECVRERNRRSR